jgi:hypothetical protein
MQTPVVTAPNGGKLVYYNKQPNITNIPDEPCWLCGFPTQGRGEYSTTGIRPGFSDRDIAKNRTGQSICEHCSWCFIQNLPMRTYSILATTSGLKLMKRNDWCNVVLDPPEPPWVGLAAESGQKFLFYRCDPNYSNNQPHIQWEEETVSISLEAPPLLELIEKLLNKGFSKTEVRTGNYYPGRLDDAGWQEVMAQDKALRFLSKERTTRLFHFLVWIARLPAEPSESQSPPVTRKTQKIQGVQAVAKREAPKKEKEVDTCCTGSKQMTTTEPQQLDLFTLST